MASPVQFSVDDSSPVLAYAPFADTFGLPDLAAGWNPYFVGSAFVSSVGQTGIGESQHITSHNGSSISLRWHGTSLQLFGNTTAGASISLVLDGVSVPLNIPNNTPNLLAFLDGLEHSDHTLVLTALTPSSSGPSLVVFDKAVITDPPPQNSSNLTFSDHTLNDNDILLNGTWSQLTFPPARESTSQGDTAQVTFSGISIRIFGTTSPSSGNYSAILDDIQSPIFSARSSFTQDDSLLFFASGLDPDVSHHIIIRNEGGSLQLKSGGSGFDIFSSGEPTALPSPSSPSSPSSSSPTNTPSPSSGIGKFAKGTIAALVLAGFLAAALLTAVLFYFCIWRPRRRKRVRQQQLDAVQEATSQLRRNPKEGQNNPVGAVLDIGQQRHPDDILMNSPVDVLTPVSPISPGTGGPYNERHRDSKQSTGFTRWKRDINTLSGLTNLGLKFRHDDSDEKSPLSDNGRGDRRYTSEMDDISPTSPSVGRMMSLTTQSSHRSLRRLGKKRSAGNNGGRGGGFPFRFNSGRSGSNNGGRDGEGPASPRARDEDSFSGLTSLSYASNPNLRQTEDVAVATPAFLDVQPPSYAASVSQHTTSGSSSGNLSPRAGSEHPSTSQVVRDDQEQRAAEQQQQRQSSSSSSSGNQQQSQLQRSDTRMRGIRMLGIGAGLSGTGGVGGPISMRAAIRGLSPRISRNRNGEGGKEREVIGEEEDNQAASSQPSIALASIGHGQYGQERREDVEIPPVPHLPPMTPERRKTDSPTIRALPPIPIPAVATTSSSEAPSKSSEQRQQQRRRKDVDISTATIVPPPSSAPSPSSPPSLSSSPQSSTHPPPIVTTTTTTEKKPFISAKVARSSPGDAVGLPPLGAIQSFSEAAAIAINTGGIQFGEGADPSSAGDAVKAGEGQRETKRSSTASRVRFEEPSTTVSGDDGTEGNKRRKEEKTGFRLTPPTPTTGGGVILPGSSSSSEHPPLASALPATTVAEYSRSSFLDLSSQPPSLHSTPSVHRNDNHDNTDDNNNNNNDRIWSMQLPGRYPPPPSSLPSQEDPALKSKWSNTTMQTITRTLGGSSSSSSSSNNHSGYRSHQRVGPASIIENEEGDVLSPTTRQNLFPFPLAIPPSPNMPEGFTGVEPSPSLMSPAVSLPVSFSSRRKEGKGKGKGRRRRFLGVAGFGRVRDGGEGEGDEDDERLENPLHLPSSSRHTGNEGSTDVTNSPTDSFPYSISDVHFRNSGVSDPEMDNLDEEDRGQLGSSGHRRSHDHGHGHTRHHHHHHQPPPPHPPLRSFTPQRFSPSLTQQSQQSQQSQLPPLRSLTPQRFDPYLSLQSHPPQSTPPPQQQQQQQHERTQSFTSSIVQRVFGMR